MPSYKNYTEKQLLELLHGSDEKAFTEIYRRYAEPLYFFAWNILRDTAECKDAIQEVFVWLWNNRGEIRVKELKPYLLAAVKYKLIRAIRNSRRRDEILATYPGPAVFYAGQEVELKELQAIVRQFTRALPPRAKEIFDLSRNQHLSNREIALRMNISEKTVENQMTITLKKLRHTLGNLSIWSVFFF